MVSSRSTSDYFPAQFLANIPLSIFNTLSNDLLLAIPFFTFMGAILERCGLAEDLLEGTGQLFGSVPGGLAYAVIIVGAILGAITGTVAASVIAMGVISLPIMLRYGYNPRIATGVIAASGTITQLIPPSLVLVVLADQLGRSVGDMYKGAIGPSIVQVLIFWRSSRWCRYSDRSWCRRCHSKRAHCSGWALWRRVLWGMVPSIVLIFLVLGTIFLGVATPTEAGALGALWRNRAGSVASPTDLATGASGDGIDDAADRDGGVHPDRLDVFFRWCFRESTATYGSSTCWRACRAAKSGF